MYTNPYRYVVVFFSLSQYVDVKNKAQGKQDLKTDSGNCE